MRVSAIPRWVGDCVLTYHDARHTSLNLLTAETGDFAPSPENRGQLRRKAMEVTKRALPSWCTLLVLVVAGAGPSAAQALAKDEQEEQKTVLVLHPSREDAPYTVLVERAFRKTLGDALGRQLDYYTEYLGFGRFSGPEYQMALRDFLRHKYEGRHLDVVIADGDEPFKFVRQNRAEIFPGVPIVFQSSEETDLSPVPNCTGVVFRLDMKSTLEVALRLQPNVKRVFVICGASEFDKFYQNFSRQQFREYEGRVAFTYLPPMPLNDLLEEVARLPKDSILYFVSLYEDGAGNKLIPADVLERLAPVANAPTYCWPEQTLGSGIVGGSLLSEETVARDTAKLALRVLHGERPDQIPPAVISPSVTAFDWRQLRRWGIRADRLPPGSIIRFREESFFERYRRYVIGGLLVFAIQSALIVGLLLERAWRIRAEADAQRTREVLAHLGRVSAIGEIAASIAHELKQPLGAIRINVAAASHLLSSKPDASTQLKEILLDIASDDERAADVIERVRALASKRATKRVCVDLNKVVQATSKLVSGNAFTHHVLISVDLAPDPPIVDGDSVQLQQVVLNLLLNAIEAASSSDGAGQPAVRATTLNDGRLAHVLVRDNGPGVPAGSEQQVFDPFYTTKESGMGMGLAISRSIVESHGGKIWACNAAESGAEFHFTIPRLTNAPSV